MGLFRRAVEGEAFARPVAGGAHADHLPLDGPAGFGFSLPDATLELNAPERMAVEALLGELAFDDHLGGDTGVVGAGEPEGDDAEHAIPMDGDVDLGVLEHVAHVQGPGDVGRRDDQGE